jgi:hypothetical protein
MPTALDEEDWVFPDNDKHKYKPYLLHLMSFLHNRLDDPYPKATEFSKEDLLAIQPHHIRKWMNIRAYGNERPTDDALVTGCRSGSLAKAKMAISFYMPNKNVPWLEGRGGNPTRHISITALIKKVKKKECRGQGRKANDKRAYRDAEFYKVLELFRSGNDWDHQYKYPMMALWSFHLIHRLDDACHFPVDAPHGSHLFPFVIMTKTKWSKNVATELGCPDQILFGAGDWRVCPQLWLAVYLNGWLGQHPNAVHLFTDNDDETAGPANLNKQYGNRVKAVCWNHPDFKALLDETGPDQKGLGTHSNRKYASTKAARKGATKPQVKYRGRWVGETNSSIVSKHYIDPRNDAYTDAFVAAALCEGGPVKYMLRDDATNVTDFWLFQAVVPNIKRRFTGDTRFCRVMGLAKLWAVFDTTASEELPLSECERIKHSFGVAFGARETNPVAKVALEVLNVNARLQIVAVATANNNNDAAAGQPQQQQQQEVQQPARAQGNSNAQLLAYIQHVEQGIMQRFDMIHAEQQAQRAWHNQMYDRIITNQRRYGGTIYSAMARGDMQEERRRDLQQQRAAADAANPPPQPERGPRAEGPGAAGPPPRARLTGRAVDREARLVARPRCLYEIWQEYQFGIGNNKPAKDFTTAERNSSREMKQKYHYRNKIWKLQSYMYNAGWTVEGMNAKIIEVYRSSHVTAIVKGITQDSKNPQYTFVESVGFRVNHRLYAGATR